jgi:predicted RNase H-like nuclease (RuvC/YqgF family)
MSDTPRTELMVERAPIGLRTNVAFEQSCDLCRQLERELNEANKTISLQHELMTTAEKRGVDKAKEELNEAKDRIKRLEEALNGTVKWIVDLAESGDAGFWDADTFPEVIAARAALNTKEVKP